MNGINLPKLAIPIINVRNARLPFKQSQVRAVQVAQQEAFMNGKSYRKMINTFTAIDFETAQGKRWSICQVGLVRVENNIITDELSILVQPPGNYYWDTFIDIHGITPELTQNAPTFNYIWHKIQPYITNQNVVAHNGFRFDFECLNQTLEFYKLSMPDFTGHCTYQIFNNNLASLCEENRIALNHHDALSDAKACAELLKLHMNQMKISYD